MEPLSLPPTDHVARVLLKRGARSEALTLLRAAVARDPGEKACAALLRAVEARPDASVFGPDLPISHDLIDTYVGRGMLIEALAVLRGSGLDREARGRERAGWLEELLAPVPATSEPMLLEVAEHLRTGGGTLALAMLEDRMTSGPPLPDWAVRRRNILRQLLLENPALSSTQSGAEADAQARAPAPASELGRLVAAQVAARNLAGALVHAQEAAAAHPDDLEPARLSAALSRLVRAIEKHSQPSEQQVTRTMPMTGHTVAELHLRMGNMAEAERFYRKLVLQSPDDEVARERLGDVQTVRRALGEPEVASLPPSVVSPPPATRPSSPGMRSPWPGVPTPAELAAEIVAEPTRAARPSARQSTQERVLAQERTAPATTPAPPPVAAPIPARDDEEPTSSSPRKRQQVVEAAADTPAVGSPPLDLSAYPPYHTVPEEETRQRKPSRQERHAQPQQPQQAQQPQPQPQPQPAPVAVAVAVDGDEDPTSAKGFAPISSTGSAIGPAPRASSSGVVEVVAAPRPAVEAPAAAPPSSQVSREVPLLAAVMDARHESATRDASIKGELPADPRRATSPESLLKKTTGKHITGDYSGARAKPSADDWSEEESTEIVSPELEAELLLKQGFPERALRIYRALAVRYPSVGKYTERIEQIALMIERNAIPIPAEVTVKRDLSALRAQARPTDMSLAVPPGTAGVKVKKGAWDEEDATLVEKSAREGERPPPPRIIDTGMPQPSQPPPPERIVSPVASEQSVRRTGPRPVAHAKDAPANDDGAVKIRRIVIVA